MAQATLEKSQTAEPSRRMSWEEFLEWKPKRAFWEWVDGEVTELTSVEQRHESLVGFLYILLTHFTGKFNSGRTMIAPFLMRLASRPSGREPDVLFVARENSSRLQGAYLDGAADLVIEVISPESDERDRVTKLAEYEAGGVREYWLLDYLAQEAFFYQLDAQGHYQRVLPDANGRYDSAILSGFWLNTDWLWQEPKPLIDAMRALNLIPTA